MYSFYLITSNIGLCVTSSTNWKSSRNECTCRPKYRTIQSLRPKSISPQSHITSVQTGWVERHSDQRILSSDL